MTDLDQRLAALEARVEQGLAIDQRLRALDDRLLAAERAQSPPSNARQLREWMQALGPYIAPLVVLVLGVLISNNIEDALKRETLDLQYAGGMRELIAGFDKAEDQGAADANAIGLAMFGRYAIVPLVERLERGDTAPVAAERGLRMIGANHAAAACPMFLAVLEDRGRRYRWQTHRTMVRLLGQSGCVDAIDGLARFAAAADAATASEAALATFAQRFSAPRDVDQESVERLRGELALWRATLGAEKT